MKHQDRPCSSCLTPRPGMVSETFADAASAFRRHAQLVDGGCAPSLCMGRDGIRRLCYFAKPAARRA